MPEGQRRKSEASENNEIKNSRNVKISLLPLIPVNANMV